MLCLTVLSLLLCHFSCKHYDLNDYYWVNRNDKITMNIDSLLGKEENINNMTAEIEKKEPHEVSLYIQMPRDLFDIKLMPDKVLDQLEIKEILFYNDEGGYLAYSFL